MGYDKTPKMVEGALTILEVYDLKKGDDICFKNQLGEILLTGIFDSVQSQLVYYIDRYKKKRAVTFTSLTLVPYSDGTWFNTQFIARYTPPKPVVVKFFGQEFTLIPVLNGDTSDPTQCKHRHVYARGEYIELCLCEIHKTDQKQIFIYDDSVLSKGDEYVNGYVHHSNFYGATFHKCLGRLP